MQMDFFNRYVIDCIKIPVIFFFFEKEIPVI